jgi:excisionase family DNA binding protein
LKLEHSNGAAMNRLLNIPQFAELLGVSNACVRRWVLERKVSVVKVGRLVRIPTTEYERLVEEGTRMARRAGEEEKCKK